MGTKGLVSYRIKLGHLHIEFELTEEKLFNKKLARANSAIGEGLPQPGIKPATRYVEQLAHDGRINLLPMGVDEDGLQSDVP